MEALAFYRFRYGKGRVAQWLARRDAAAAVAAQMAVAT